MNVLVTVLDEWCRAHRHVLRSPGKLGDTANPDLLERSILRNVKFVHISEFAKLHEYPGRYPRVMSYFDSWSCFLAIQFICKML
jgi:hypothetical protein